MAKAITKIENSEAAISIVNSVWESIGLTTDRSCKLDIWTKLDESKSEMIFPVEGMTVNDVRSGFGNRTHPLSGKTKHHDGFDVSAPVGTNVVSATQGTITFAGKGDASNGRSGYGNTVEIETTMSDGRVLKTRYAHLNEIKPGIEVGQSIGIGEKIGGVGKTGAVTGPHLHFEVRIDGDLQDPKEILKQYQEKHNPSIVQSPSLTP